MPKRSADGPTGDPDRRAEPVDGGDGKNASSRTEHEDAITAAIAIQTDPQEAASELAERAYRELEASSDARPRAARLHHALGVTANAREAHGHAALFHAQRALEICPDDPAYLQFARKIYYGRRSWGQCLNLIDAELARTAEDSRRAELLLDKGDLLEDQLASPVEAISCYEQALAADPHNRLALHRLRGLLRKSGDHGQWASVQQRVIACTTDGRLRAHLHAELAAVRLTALGDIQQATESYGVAHGEDPAHDAAWLALRQLLEQQQRWGDLVDLWLKQAEEVVHSHDKAECYVEAGRLCRDKLRQPERALDCLQRAVTQDASNMALLGETAELLEAAGRNLELAELERRLLVDAGPDEAAALRIKLAGIEEQRSSHDEAIAYYRDALEHVDGHGVAEEALQRLYRQGQCWEELVELNLASMRLFELPEQKARCAAEAALICEQQLDDIDGAVQHHQQALALYGACEPSRRALERLLLKTEAYEDLLVLLDQGLVDDLPDEQAEALLRMGTICEALLGDPHRAIGYYERALAQRDACKGAIHALQRLYEQTDQPELLVKMLSREAELLTDPDRVVVLALRAADLCERRLGRDEDGASRYEELLQRHPANWVVIDALVQSCQRRGKWQRVYDLLSDALDRGAVPEGHRSRVNLRLGELAESRLQRTDEALGHFQSALSHETTHGAAFRALARIYRREGRWNLLCKLLEQETAASHGTARGTMCYALGQLYQAELKQPDDAARCYRAAIESDAENGAAREALIGLLMDTGRAREAAALLAQGIDIGHDDRVRRRLLKRLAGIYHTDLAAPQDAIRCLERAAEGAPEEPEVLCSLAAMYEQEQDPLPLASTYARLSELTPDVTERLRLLHCAAHLTGLQPSGAQDAVGLYQRVLEQSPQDARAIAALSRLYSSQADPSTAEHIAQLLLAAQQGSAGKWDVLLCLALCREAVGDLAGAEAALAEAATASDDWVVAHELRRIREQRGRGPALAAALQREGELSRDPRNAAELSLRAAILLQDECADEAGAVRALRRALEITPFDDDAAQRLERILTARSDWAGMVESIRVRLRRMEQVGGRPAGATNQARVALLLRMARIERDELAQPHAAVETLRELLAVDDHHLPGALLLADTYEALELWHEAVDALARIAAIADDSALLASAHLRSGRILQEQLGDPGRAIAALQNVLVVHAQDAGALRRLLDLFLDASDWDNAADSASRLLEVEQDVAAQLDLHLTLADVMEQGFGDPEAAAEQLEEAAEINPLGERVVDRLSQLYGRLGRPEEQCRVIAAHVDALPSRRQQQGIARRMLLAELLQSRQLDQEALAQYELVARLDPSHVGSRLELARARSRHGDQAAAVEAYREVLEIDPTHSACLSELRTLWSHSGDRDLAYAAAAALVCCGSASEADQQEYRQRRREGPRGPQMPLNDALFEGMLVHPDEPSAGRAILAALADVAHRIRPPDFDAWQIGRADRLAPGSDEPVKVLVQQVARTLGLKQEVGVYLSPLRAQRIELLLTDPPALVVGGGAMASLSSREARCWMGSLLAHLRSGCWVSYGCDGHGLARLVEAAALAADPALRIGHSTETEGVRQMAQQIKRGLNRRGRDALIDAVSALAGLSEPPDFERWVLASRRTALRTALWVVNDLGVTLNYLRVVDDHLAEASTPEEMGAVVRDHPLAADLVRFWTSEHFLGLQRASGAR